MRLIEAIFANYRIHLRENIMYNFVVRVINDRLHNFVKKEKKKKKKKRWEESINNLNYARMKRY